MFVSIYFGFASSRLSLSLFYLLTYVSSPYLKLNSEYAFIFWSRTRAAVFVGSDYHSCIISPLSLGEGVHIGFAVIFYTPSWRVQNFKGWELSFIPSRLLFARRAERFSACFTRISCAETMCFLRLSCIKRAMFFSVVNSFGKNVSEFISSEVRLFCTRAGIYPAVTFEFQRVVWNWTAPCILKWVLCMLFKRWRNWRL